ncbi:MAG: hypothetical protein ABL921_31280 [Pirellula sp.]
MTKFGDSILDSSEFNNDCALTLPKSQRYDVRRLIRWFGILVFSLVVTTAACTFSPIRFASGEQLLLSLSAIAFAWIFVKVVTSHGRFRFFGILVFTALVAAVCSYVVAPLKKRTDQKAAIALLRSQGGEVEIARSARQYPHNAMGWVPGPYGFPYPAALHYFEETYLNPEYIVGVNIPSGLLTTELIDSLHADFYRVHVLLNGKGNPANFESALLSRLRRYSLAEEYSFRPLVFVIEKLQPSDIDFLNEIPTTSFGAGKLPISLGQEAEFDPRLLDTIHDGFELVLNSAPFQMSVLERTLQCERLKCVTLRDIKMFPTLRKLLPSRTLPLDSLRFSYVNFTPVDWQQLCNMTNIRSLLIFQSWIGGKPFTEESLQLLARMAGLEELKMDLSDGHDLSWKLIENAQFRKLTLYSTVEWNDRLKEAIHKSSLTELVMTTEGASVVHEPWMNKLHSLRINGVEFVRAE